jgi:hypothetical protein
MLKESTMRRLAAIATVTVTAAVCAGLISAGTAVAWPDGGPQSPPTLNGDWAPFNRCPVDDPLMLAADGEQNVALCLTIDSPSGSITIGNATYAAAMSNAQIGLSLSNTDGTMTPIAPQSGALLAAPVGLPGGLAGLICPSASPVAWRICNPRHDKGDRGHDGGRGLTEVTATMLSAGKPSDFNLFAGLSSGQPIVSLPVKIHLQNALLGRSCYLGSDTEPIVLQLQNQAEPTGSIEAFDSDGTPDPNGTLIRFALQDTQGSDGFAVPAAQGCGFRGLFDLAINSKVGLPSPAGKNSLTLENVSIYVAGINDVAPIVPNDGKELSKDWHSAVLPKEGRRDHHW